MALTDTQRTALNGALSAHIAALQDTEKTSEEFGELVNRVKILTRLQEEGNG